MAAACEHSHCDLCRAEDLYEFSVSGPDPVRELWTPVTSGPVDSRGLGINVHQLARTEIIDGIIKLAWRKVVLASVTVPHERRMILRGFRQYLTIAGRVAISKFEDGIFVERPVVTPSWCFPDGGVKWHITWMQGHTSVDGTLGKPLARPDPVGGRPVLGLGTFYDIRSPWSDAQPTYNAVFEGLGTLVFWAEVLQPDPSAQGGDDQYGLIASEPDTIDQYTVSLAMAPLAYMSPEDAFVASATKTNIRNIKYRRIAGSLIAQFTR